MHAEHWAVIISHTDLIFRLPRLTGCNVLRLIRGNVLCRPGRRTKTTKLAFCFSASIPSFPPLALPTPHLHLQFPALHRDWLIVLVLFAVIGQIVWRVSWLDDGHVEAKVIAEPWKLEDITYCLDLFRIGLASSNPVFMALAAVFVTLRLSQQPLYIGLIHSIFLNRLFLINRSAKWLLWV